jgi:hypothetical protein
MEYVFMTTFPSDEGLIVRLAPEYERNTAKTSLVTNEALDVELR